MYVCQYLISLTSFLPDIFIILYNPSRYFFGLPFFLNCHRALPPKFKRIPSCFSECFEKIPSLNLNSEFIDLCPDLALSSRAKFCTTRIWNFDYTRQPLR